MSLEPVDATLIAASVGVVASTSAVVITHLLTIARDRRHKVWDRRMDAYKHLLRSRRDFAVARRQFLTRDDSPELVDYKRELKEFNLIGAELEMFGSTVVTTFNLLSIVMLNQWMNATSEWNKLRENASDNADARRKAEKKWEEIKKLSKVSDKLDERLTEAIKKEAEFRVPFRLQWWRTPLRRRAIKR